MAVDADGLAGCPDCGLLQLVPEIERAALISCSRCGALIRQVRPRSVPFCGACGAIGLVLLALAFFFPIARVWVSGGRFADGDLGMGPERLRATGASALALAVVCTLMAAPVFKFVTVLAMAIGTSSESWARWLKPAFTFVPLASEWAMLDVFLLGAMIALFRLRAWMLLTFGPALFALAASALCSVGIDAGLDRTRFWRRVPRAAPSRAAAPSASFSSCTHCGLVTDAAEGQSCPRCGRVLKRRAHAGATRTWALIATAALLAIPANVLPVMTITKLGRGGPSTILGGTIELARLGFWGLAAVVFVASILVPIVKLTGLAVLLVSVRRRSARSLQLRTRLFRLIARIGRWSMVDVFATMTLVTMARFGWLGNVRPEPGASAFCAVVVFTMLASESFDPRTMWDAAGLNLPPRPAAGEAS